MSSLDLIIYRLPKPPRKATARPGIARAFRAACPCCEGHGMPLSLAETPDEMVLLHCFGGCSAGAVLQALGMGMDDLFPSHENVPHATGMGGPSKWGALASAIDGLHRAHCALMAACSPAMDQGEIKQALRALLAAGEAMQQVKMMARQALKNGGAA